jgi:hypothetical protein
MADMNADARSMTVESARQELIALKRLLASGRDGASREWIEAAEEAIALAQRAYRHAMIEERLGRLGPASMIPAHITTRQQRAN